MDLKKTKNLVASPCKYFAQRLIIQRFYKRDLTLIFFYFLFFTKTENDQSHVSIDTFSSFLISHSNVIFVQIHDIRNVFLHFNLIIDYLHISLDFLNLFSK